MAVTQAFVEDSLWPFFGVGRLVRSGTELAVGGITQLGQRFVKTYPKVAQEILAASSAVEAVESMRVGQTLYLSSEAARSTQTSIVKAIGKDGSTHVLHEVAPGQFAAVNRQNLVAYKPLFVLTNQNELRSTFSAVVNHYGLTEEKDAAILHQIAQRKENKNHLFEVDLRYYARVEVGKEKYVYVEVDSHGSSHSAMYWRLHDPALSHSTLLPSMTWNEVLGKWRPADPRLAGGGKLSLSSLKDGLRAIGARLGRDDTALMNEWREWAQAPILEQNRIDTFSALGEVLAGRSDSLNLGQEIHELPPRLSECKHLEHLVLNVAAIGSNVPKLPATLRTLEIQSIEGLQGVLSAKEERLSELLRGLNKLEKLVVRDGPFTRITLPANQKHLKHVILSNNQLTSADALQFEMPWSESSLETLDLSGNKFFHVPQTLYRLPRSATVNMENNPISQLIFKSLQERVSASEYPGPQFRISLVDQAFVDMQGPILPLHEAVARYFPESRQKEVANEWLTQLEEAKNQEKWEEELEEAAGPSHREPGPSRQVSNLSPKKTFLSADEQEQLSKFLTRLGGLPNEMLPVQTKAFKASKMQPLLEDLYKFVSLRKKILSLINEGEKANRNYLALTFIDLEQAHTLYRIEANRASWLFSQNKLNEIWRRAFRLEQLKDIAHDIAKTIKVVDEKLVHLALVVKLQDDLKISGGVIPKEMLYFELSGVTDAHLNAAQFEVKVRENKNYKAWLLELPSRLSYMRSTSGDLRWLQRELGEIRANQEKFEQALKKNYPNPKQMPKSILRLSDEQRNKFIQEKKMVKIQVMENDFHRVGALHLLNEAWPEVSAAGRGSEVSAAEAGRNFYVPIDKLPR